MATTNPLLADRRDRREKGVRAKIIISAWASSKTAARKRYKSGRCGAP